MAMHWSQNFQVFTQNELQLPVQNNPQIPHIQQYQKLTRPRDVWAESLRQGSQPRRFKFRDTHKNIKKRRQKVNPHKLRQNQEEHLSRYHKLTQLRENLGRVQKRYHDIHQKPVIVKKTKQNVQPEVLPILLDQDQLYIKKQNTDEVIIPKTPQVTRKYRRNQKSKQMHSSNQPQLLNKRFQKSIVQYIRACTKEARESANNNGVLECIHIKPSLDNLPIKTHRKLFANSCNGQNRSKRYSPPHLRRHRRKVNRRFNNTNLTKRIEERNLEVCVGSTSFNCRSSVLSTFSEYFAKEVAKPKLTIFLPEEEVRPGIFATIYNWMLSTRPLLQHIDIWELLRAANFLRIRQLIDQCISRLEVLGNRVYLKACARQLHKSEEYLLKRICEAYYNLESLQQPLNYSIGELEQFLRNRKDGSEILKLMVSARWLNHKWSDRKIYIPALIHKLNFDRMPPWFLTALRKNLHCPPLKNVMRQKELWYQINDAMFHKTEMYLTPPRAIKNTATSGIIGKFFAKKHSITNH